MISNTPEWVARWLTATLEIRPSGHPDHPILKALATDARMAALWDEIGQWPAPALVMLMRHASYFAERAIITEMLRPPNERVGFGFAERSLASAAESLISAIQTFPDAAVELWHPPIDDLVTRVGALAEAELRRARRAPIDDLVGRLREFARRATAEAEFRRRVFDHISAPSKQGRGSPEQLVYREALDRVLRGLPHVGPRREQRDRITALLTSVVFQLTKDVDPDTISRTRRRQRSKIVRHNPDNFA